VSITDKVLEALRTAILLESRVSALAAGVGDLAKDVRDIDRRLVRVETVIELGTKGGFSSAAPIVPPAIEDGR
jgi:hypothetical protein